MSYYRDSASNVAKVIFTAGRVVVMVGFRTFFFTDGGAAGGNLYIISRDTVYSFRGAGAVRVSCFWRRGSGSDAEFIASSHKVYGTLAEFRRDCLLPSGWLHVGNDWRENIKGVA